MADATHEKCEKNPRKNVVQEPGVKKPLWRPWRRRKNNITVGIKLGGTAKPKLMSFRIWLKLLRNRQWTSRFHIRREIWLVVLMSDSREDVCSTYPVQVFILSLFSLRVFFKPYLSCVYCCNLMCICLSHLYLLYLMRICCILCVFVVSYVYLLYSCVFVVLMCICCTLMCICCTMCVLIFLL